jgi:hypothetical protein
MVDGVNLGYHVEVPQQGENERTDGVLRADHPTVPLHLATKHARRGGMPRGLSQLAVQGAKKRPAEGKQEASWNLS